MDSLPEAVTKANPFGRLYYWVDLFLNWKNRK
jgi:hypothetical protein